MTRAVVLLLLLSACACHHAPPQVEPDADRSLRIMSWNLNYGLAGDATEGVGRARGVAEVLERVDLWPLTGRLEAGAVLRATVRATRHGMTHLDVAGETLRIPAIAVAPDTPVRLRVQAREVALATRRPESLSIRNILPARVLSVDVDQTVFAELLLDVGGQHLRSRITREAVAELGLDVGQPVYALIKSVAFEGRLLA